MKIFEFANKYNFHDCRINNIVYSEDKKEFCFTLYPSVYFEHKEKKSQYIVKFSNVESIKCVENLSEIDEYLLNIWKVDKQKDMLEILFDDDNDTTIYLIATDVEIV